MSSLPNISDASDCFTAQTIPELFGNDFLSPDVGGLAVAMSSMFFFLSPTSFSRQNLMIVTDIVFNLTLRMIYKLTFEEIMLAH